jgi:hypothetical protein
MASTPAAGRGATLSGDVVVRETVEAETRQLRRDRTVAFGCHIPRPLTTTHDSLESMSVDVGPSMELPGRVRHQHRTPRAEAPVLSPPAANQGDAARAHTRRSVVEPHGRWPHWFCVPSSPPPLPRCCSVSELGTATPRAKLCHSLSRSASSDGRAASVLHRISTTKHYTDVCRL